MSNRNADAWRNANANAGSYTGGVPLTTKFTLIARDEARDERIHVALARTLGPLSGHWQVLFAGRCGSMVWDMLVDGPDESYEAKLDGAAGEHEPNAIADVLDGLRHGRR